MTVSVVIPTYNGGNKIGGLIESLRAQIYKEFEVVIVIDGSMDNTRKVLEETDLTFVPFRIIYQSNNGRASVRNRGALEANGELLIFFDDDMLPLKNCIEEHVKHHKQYPNSIVTGGLGEEVNKLSPDILKYKSYLSSKWTNALKTDNNGKLINGSHFLTAANFSISKTTFIRLHGFDEQLRDAEDFDLAVRAIKADIPLYFKKNAFAWHNDSITCKTYIRRQREYTKAINVLTRLKPWLVTEGFIKNTAPPSKYKAYLYKLFLSRIWIDAADKNHFVFLPKPWRYKLYDIIVAANGIYFSDRVTFN
jgi:glycosyltransferase involved in cell wall biosynthesis